MIVAAALIVGSVLMGWLAPALLRQTTGDPALALVCWVTAIVGVLGSAIAGAILLIALGDYPHATGQAWLHCWPLFGHSHVHPADELIGGAFAAILLVSMGRASGLVAGSLRRQKRMYRAHLAIPHTQKIDRVLWLEHDEPFAYSIGGRPGLVVATAGLRRLPEEYVDAVLQHERQHLRGRHHWLVILVDALRVALPGVPLFRAAPAMVRLLTELTADATAVQQCGRTAVQGALLALQEQGMRLQQLAAPAHGPAARVTACITSTIMPLLLGAIVMYVVLLIGCSVH